MRLGVYIDGFNLYYGGRGICGRGTPGWRWLDLRDLAARLIARRISLRGASIARLVYCTAQIDQATNPSGYADQDVYLRALRASSAVDQIEMGYYVTRVKYAPLAVRGSGARGLPRLIVPQWPLMVHAANGAPAGEYFMVSVADREEKGSDVNVASHPLVDVLTEQIDAAIVISNDSDLRFPVEFARTRVPVGLVNPTKKHLAGSLRGTQADGGGGHWWYQLCETDFRRCQLADPAGGFAKPLGW